MVMPTWADITIDAFKDLWRGFINFLPNFLVAIIVLIVGWIIASVFGRLAEEIVKRLKIDQAIERLGLGRAFKRAKMNINSGRWVNLLVKVFLLIVTLMAVTKILGLSQITIFLKDVVDYIPKIIAAMVILLVGVLVANFLGRMVKAATAGGRIKVAGFLGGLTKWSILVFAFMAALNQLGEQMIPGLARTLFSGLVYGVALAAGIAFGLGGKDEAQRIYQKIRSSVSRS